MQSDSPKPEGKVNWYFLLYCAILDSLWVKMSKQWDESAAEKALFMAVCHLVGGVFFWAVLIEVPEQPLIVVFVFLMFSVLVFHEIAMKKARKRHNLRANLKYYRQHKTRIRWYNRLFLLLVYGNLALSLYLLDQSSPYSVW